MDETIRNSDVYWDGKHYDSQGFMGALDLPFYLRQTKIYGDPILELACGTGRICLPLSEAGFTVTGIDSSEPMLMEAIRKAGKNHPNLLLQQADIRAFALNTLFSLVIFPFNALAHLLTRSDIDNCFQCVGTHLMDRGRFIIDYFNPSLEILIRDPRNRYPVFQYQDPDGQGLVTVTENNVYDRFSQINHIKWHYRIGETGSEFTKDLDMRMFFPQELDALLHYNGFRIQRKYGDYQDSPFSSESKTQLIICSKR